MYDSKRKTGLWPVLPARLWHGVAVSGGRLHGTFELNATREQSAEFVNSLKLCTIAVSLGDAETLIEHPATMTHSTYTPEALEQAGIGESMLRLSVGLEDAEDIIADLKAGLDNLQK